MSNRIYLRDDDSKRDVYLGSQEAAPPDKIVLLERYRMVGATDDCTRYSTWRRVSQYNGDHLYEQHRPDEGAH